VSLCPQDIFCPSAGTGRYRRMPGFRPGLACRPCSNKHWIRRKNRPFRQCCWERVLWPTTSTAEPDGRARGRIGSRSSPAVVPLFSADCYFNEGLSTRVRIRVRFPVRFHAQFAGRPDRDPILYMTPITMVCLHISGKTNEKFTCGIPLAANRTPSRVLIRTRNRTSRRY
jgi:hypothetical protein